MVEFTGERVVPGQVDADLWNEHLARYAFARRYVSGKRVLDCGCGAGYGAAELAQDAAVVTGVDISPDAIAYARSNYPRPNLEFLTASCLDLPFPDASFDLITAFEVIEHLASHGRFIDECARLLAENGIVIVSTPNKSYYAESRADSGPNPFHEHEFEAGEFITELTRVFPHTALLAQNRVECFAFSADTPTPADTRLDNGAGPVSDAHFFIALCSRQPLPPPASFVYVPKAANLLREREQHIKLLEEQVRKTWAWLTETQEDRNRLLDRARAQLEQLEERNRWAESLNIQLNAARERIDQLQREFAAEQQAGAAMARTYELKVADLEAESAAKTKWALDIEARLTAEIQRLSAELLESNRLLTIAEATVEERTLWAQTLLAEKQALETQLNFVRASRWLKLGRTLHLGPALQ